WIELMRRQGLGFRHYTALVLAALVSLFASTLTGRADDDSVKLHALTFLDQPKYPADFPHLDYVNPNAPKGGSVTYGITGQGDGASFDNFNPYTIRGSAAVMPGLTESLTTSPDDDTLSEYGL